ncbi:MAG: trypsin-like peptidase domain-containing protein [Legionella sp.]|nr:trypsin-like peptidase domain-containing protein [Legionella sp.]
MKKQSLLFVVLAIGLAQSSQGFSENLQNLLPDERNSIDVFQKSAPKVVFVSRLTTVVDRILHKKSQVPDGAGTGIIWNDQGYIVTNYHVIEESQNLEVTIDKMKMSAKVVGKEPRMDLAVLKVNSPEAIKYLRAYQPFNFVRLQDLIVGQKTIAIGNPFGLDHSMSKGIISALGRDVPGIGGVTIPNMIQTDAAINPGNSGGPLLSSAGELIGINTTIFSRSGASSGIGFAIPADDVKLVVNQIIKKGRVTLSGIGIHQVSQKDADKMGVREGILIADVVPNSPAASAKLQGTHKDSRGRRVRGDIIMAVNGHHLVDYNDFYNFLKKIKIGEKINLSIQRGNKQMDIAMKTIDVADLPTPVGHKTGYYHTYA